MSLHSPEPLQTGPPVTPEPVAAPDLVQAAAPEATPLRPPPESELVEAGRLTMGQLAQAHRDRLETGKPVLDVIVERGWAPPEEGGAVRAAHGIAPPAPVEVPPVEAAAEPASEEQPVPPPPA